MGKNFIVWKYTRMADVYAYEKSYDPVPNILIVRNTTAYDNLLTGPAYILLFNESLYYGSRMDPSLFNSNQIRKYGDNIWGNFFNSDTPFSIQFNDAAFCGSLYFPCYYGN